MKRSWSSIIYFIVFIIFGLLAKECSKSLTKNALSNIKSEPTFKDSLNTFLKSFPYIQDTLSNYIDKVNKKIKSNENLTKFDSARLNISDTSLNYYYTFQKNRIEEMNLITVKEVIEQYADSIVPNSESFSIFRKFNTNIYFNYYDKNHKFIIKVKGKYNKRIITN